MISYFAIGLFGFALGGLFGNWWAHRKGAALRAAAAEVVKIADEAKKL